MKSVKNRILFLAVLFVAALAGYFIISQRAAGKRNKVLYTTVDEPSLPVVWADTCGEKMDVMRGYLTDTTSDIAADTLIMIPADRKLPIHIEDGVNGVQKIRYEIRTADLSELVEKTDVTESAKTEKGIDAVLPIQNLVLSGQEYRMDIILTVQGKGEIHYYSRIAFDETGKATDMIALADGFSAKNFNYDAARENTTYLETDATGDNSTLGHVTLKSNFSQLTYGGLKLAPIGTRDVRLLEYNGSMGVMEICFMASSDGEDGSQELYEIRESFSMRMGPERLYMMDYTRDMHEVFMGNEDQFSSKRLILGISDADAVQSVKSADGKHTAFVTARDLWTMDSGNNSCVKVYSFRSGTDSGIRSNFEKHNLKVLSVEADGSMEFLLYGYMNRGRHEGQVGIALMRYDVSQATVIEQAFIPSARSFEELEGDLNRLSYLGANSMLYLKLGNGFYGLDTKSCEYIVITDTLHEGTWAVSPNQSRIAWQDKDDAFGSEVVHFMNLETGTKKELKSGSSQLIKPIGFVDLDLAVGIAETENVWNINGIDREIPFTAIEIVDDSLNSQKHYEKQGNYLTRVYTADSSIHLTQVKKTGEHSFAKCGEDTIVCNVAPEKVESISTYTADITEKTFYIPLDHDIRNRSVRMSTPGAINYDQSQGLDPVKDETEGKRYYAWGHGKLIGTYEKFGTAVDAAYADMGLVRTGGKLVYARSATAGVRTLRNPDTAAKNLMELRTEGKLSDLYGISLKEALYFVSRGMHVLCYTDAGEPLILYAYDRTQISVYQVLSGGYVKLGMTEAESMFDNGRNDFSCSFTSP